MADLFALGLLPVPPLPPERELIPPLAEIGDHLEQMPKMAEALKLALTLFVDEDP